MIIVYCFFFLSKQKLDCGKQTGITSLALTGKLFVNKFSQNGD